MRETHHISASQLTIDGISHIIDSNAFLSLSEESKSKIIKCRSYLDNKLEGGKDVFYGINTGFGSLCNTVISNDD